MAMYESLKARSAKPTPSVLFLALRTLVFVLPAAILLGAGMRCDGSTRLVLGLGAACQFLICILAIASERNLRQPLGTAVITVYLIALGWLWLAAQQRDDWFLHLAQAILLVVPLLLFSLGTLLGSGAPALRRARLLTERLTSRKHWPAELAACRNLPEVKALREAIYLDATPALGLLGHPRVAVRVAALAALEFRKNWRPGQAELVLQVAQHSPEPTVRAAAINALANADDRLLVEGLAGFLRDPSWEVRRAAAEALLWDGERRWPWIRMLVRQALADPDLQDDGPLRCEGAALTPEILDDLGAWAAEKGILAVRAAQSLAAHYGRVLSTQPDDALLDDLARQLASPQTPAPLRLELAELLRPTRRWETGLQEQLLDPKNPAPLRLLAADALLTDPQHAGALAALYDIARLPNREIALATADILQRRLGLDLGLVPGGSLPLVHSRQAAEVTRRVMLWAEQERGINDQAAASTETTPPTGGTDTPPPLAVIVPASIAHAQAALE